MTARRAAGADEGEDADVVPKRSGANAPHSRRQ
jgi:hypothetical protein